MLFYHVVRILFRIVAWPMFRFRVEGLEHLPTEGPGVLVAPHRSWLDPACVIAACRRPVRFLILESVYRRRWTRWLYHGLHCIPVRAGGGPITVVALRGALRALRDGQLIAVFPEGRVFSRESPGPMHPGAALLAARGSAPVVPVYIEGSSDAWPHGRAWPGPARVRVRIGEAMDPPTAHDRETLHRYLARVEARLEQLGREASAA